MKREKLWIQLYSIRRSNLRAIVVFDPRWNLDKRQVTVQRSIDTEDVTMLDTATDTRVKRETEDAMPVDSPEAHIGQMILRGMMNLANSTPRASPQPITPDHHHHRHRYRQNAPLTQAREKYKMEER